MRGESKPKDGDGIRCLDCRAASGCFGAGSSKARVERVDGRSNLRLAEMQQLGRTLWGEPTEEKLLREEAPYVILSLFS